MDNKDQVSFSHRHGYAPQEREITIREEAPRELREAVLQLSMNAWLLNLDDVHKVVCKALHRLPDPDNWSGDSVLREVRNYIQECEWFKVYDIAEALYEYLASERSPENAQKYEDSLNQYFREKGIGWQMVGGKINTRGPEAFEEAVHEAAETLEAAGRLTARDEIHEAIADLSRRPNPDKTGAIHHAMAALECVARDICGDAGATLGQLLRQHSGKLSLPKPLDVAVEKVWGYASEIARHVQEGKAPDYDEAQLIVTLAAAVSNYLSRKNPRES